MKLLAALFVTCALHAQTSSSAVEFEVASVKPTDKAKSPTLRWSYDGGFVIYNRANLKVLVMDAYDLKYYQCDAPAWFEMEQYDVSAKIPAGASEQQVPAMLQRLLSERFKLVVHREIRDQASFVLEVGKNGLS